MAKRIITTDILEEDVSSEKNLRPQTLEQYIGQEKAKENLKVYIAGSFPFLWTSGTWKDDACRYHCQ